MRRFSMPAAMGALPLNNRRGYCSAPTIVTPPDEVGDALPPDYDPREAALQDAHDTAYALAAILKRRPGSGGRKQRHHGGAPFEAVNTIGLESDYATSPDPVMQAFAPLAALYHELYRKMSGLVTSDLVNDLDASLNFLADKKQVINGVPRRKSRAAFAVSNMHMHQPFAIQLLSGKSEVGTRHHAIQHARALRNKSTYRSIYFILENEWPASGGPGCVQVHAKLFECMKH